jgi:cation diffusion facilitator family transporter
VARSAALRASIIGIGANIFLLVLKAAASLFSDSLTIFSETVNSFSDVLSAVVILLCVSWAWKKPDESHPFGHRRAEPVAGLIVAIFTCILGFEVSRTALINLVQGNLPEQIGPYPAAALAISMTIKALMTIYFRRRGNQLNSPALRATAVDCRNDVLLTLLALAAILLAEFHVPRLDTIAALVVGAYIIYSGYEIGIENLDYLMGKAPADKLLHEIRRAASGISKVREIDHVKGHYVGTFIHVELTARVDGLLSTRDSHSIAERVREAVERIESVDRAFVHIEPLASKQMET